MREVRRIFDLHFEARIALVKVYLAPLWFPSVYRPTDDFGSGLSKWIVAHLGRD